MMRNFRACPKGRLVRAAGASPRGTWLPVESGGDHPAFEL